MKKNFIIALSFFIALLLEIIPLPRWADWLRPEWVLLILIFWITVLPNRINVGVAFIIGLFLDLLQGTLLGENALILVLISYLIIKFYPRMRLFPTIQQALVVLMIVIFYQGMKFCLQALLGQYPGTYLYWLPAITSAILWPGVYSLLKNYREHYRLNY